MQADRIAQRTEPWARRARQEIAAGLSTAWLALERATTRALETVTPLVERASDDDLEQSSQVSNLQLLADAHDLLEHLKQKQGLGFWLFRAPVVKRCKYLWSDTRFRGRRCDSAATLSALIERLVRQDAAADAVEITREP